jgi:hypothetical protein
MAISELGTLAGPVDRIILARAYDVKEWLPLAYQTLCQREACLSDAEGHRLGIDDVLKIARGRMAMRSKEVVLDAPGRIALVDELFSQNEQLVEVKKGRVAPPPIHTCPVSTQFSDTLVIPASVLHSATQDLILSPLPSGISNSLRTAVTAAISAQHEAKLVRSIFDPMIVTSEVELAEARHLSSSEYWDEDDPSLCIRAQERANIEERRLNMHKAQILKSEAELKHAQEVVASLLAGVCG